MSSSLNRQTPAIIHEGDVLTSTCSFDNTTDQLVKWGEGTSNEMCYNHVVAWPPHSVTSTPHGKDCIGLLPSSVH